MKMKTLILALALFALSFVTRSVAQSADSSPGYLATHSDAAQTIQHDTADVVLAVDRLQTDVLASDSIEASRPLLIPYRREIERGAAKRHLAPWLVAGIIQEESLFDTWASRTELAYERKAVVKRGAKTWSRKHGGLPTYNTELRDRAQSKGLMQTMGQLAREQGFGARYLSALHLPENSIEQGTIKLDTLFKRYGKDTLAVISAYNAGSARKQYGAFVNARYVWRVTVAAQAYHEIFDSPQASNEIIVDTNEGKHTARFTPRFYSRVVPDRNTDALPITFEQIEERHDTNRSNSDSARHSQIATGPSDGSGEANADADGWSPGFTFAVALCLLATLYAIGNMVVSGYAHYKRHAGRPSGDHGHAQPVLRRKYAFRGRAYRLRHEAPRS